MHVVYERCCGIDVHKKTVVACVLTPEGKETRTCGTMTADLLLLSDWLKDQQCQMVAMESTGYWKPVYNGLEAAGIPLLVVNAKHAQRVPGAVLRPAEEAVPGRKTDVKDAEWIADLLRHGRLKASFIPDRTQRELAALVRYRRSLVEERVREANRIQLPWVEAEPPGPTGDAGGREHQAGQCDQYRPGGVGPCWMPSWREPRPQRSWRGRSGRG